MTMVDVQVFDIAPKKDDNNALFHDLINIEPYIEPYRAVNTRKDANYKRGDSDQHFFRKRKWFKKIPLYKNCRHELEDENRTYEDWDNWKDWTFTDMTIFEWHRWFLRKSKYWNRLRVYVQWFINPEECTNWVYSDITQGKIVDVTGKDFLNTSPCAHSRFLNTWWLKWNSESEGKDLLKEGWVLKNLNWNSVLSEWVLYNKKEDISISEKYSVIRLNDTGMVIRHAGKVCPDIREEYNLPEGAIFVQGAMQMNYYTTDTMFDKCKAIKSSSNDPYENEIKWGISIANSTWPTLSFITNEGIVSISSYSQQTSDNFSSCFNLDLSTALWSTGINWDIITGATEFWGSIALIKNNGTLTISAGWDNMLWFPAQIEWDLNTGIHKIPYSITDAIASNWHLILIGPHETYYYSPWDWKTWPIMWQISDVSWYFSQGSWYHKDGRIFIARSFNDLYMLQISNYYGKITWEYNYYSNGLNSHLRHLNKSVDKIWIDLTDNETYVTIYDNSSDKRPYSKIMIQDRFYNFWYSWIIDWARITRVKHWIFFWDAIYSNEWDTDNGQEIKQIISAFFGDQTRQASKHFVQWKLALGRHSKISRDTKIETTLLSWGEELKRIVPITSTLYPNLIQLNKDKEYDIGKKIKPLNKEHTPSFQNEIQGYLNLNPQHSIKTPLEETEVSSYASIKEAVNESGEIIKLTLTAVGKDEVEFGGMFLTYYPEDYDFDNIANSNVDEFDAPTYQSERLTHELDKVESDITLWHI